MTKRIVTREGNSVKLDLTWPFLIWMAVFLGLGLWTKSTFLIVIGMMPLLLVALFMIVGVIFSFFGLVAMAVAYASGKPINITKNGKSVKTIQIRRER